MLIGRHLQVAFIESDPSVLAVRPVLRGAAPQQRLAQDLLVLPFGLCCIATLRHQIRVATSASNDGDPLQAAASSGAAACAACWRVHRCGTGGITTMRVRGVIAHGFNSSCFHRR